MIWGVENEVVARFVAAGITREQIPFARETYTFDFDGPPSELVDEFRNYYGPTMNAFDAAEKTGRAADLARAGPCSAPEPQRAQGVTSIPATFLRRERDSIDGHEMRCPGGIIRRAPGRHPRAPSRPQWAPARSWVIGPTDAVDPPATARDAKRIAKEALP